MSHFARTGYPSEGKRLDRVETIGKILSITLLTIFGSAAATVYLVDNNILPGFFGNAQVTYTSDSSTSASGNGFYVSPERRHSNATKYKAAERAVTNEEPLPGEYKSAIWGQSYDIASRPASGDSALLEDKIEYWRREYAAATESGRTRDADRAYRNYRELEDSAGMNK